MASITERIAGMDCDDRKFANSRESSLNIGSTLKIRRRSCEIPLSLKQTRYDALSHWYNIKWACLEFFAKLQLQLRNMREDDENKLMYDEEDKVADKS